VADEQRKQIEERWNEYAKQHLLGRTIKSVRYLTTEEMKELGWRNRSVVLILDDSTVVWPSTDDEGNNAGALFGSKADGEDLTFPVIP
tara:strand:+ start:464 stop:727 length:264 start_codon:yes stop_codon:yes gene_type:complete